MKEKKSKETPNKTQRGGGNQSDENGIKKKMSKLPQQDGSAGDIKSGHKAGRHGTDDEKNLNPEE